MGQAVEDAGARSGGSSAENQPSTGTSMPLFCRLMIAGGSRSATACLRRYFSSVPRHAFELGWQSEGELHHRFREQRRARQNAERGRERAHFGQNVVAALEARVDGHQLRYQARPAIVGEPGRQVVLEWRRAGFGVGLGREQRGQLVEGLEVSSQIRLSSAPRPPFFRVGAFVTVTVKHREQHGQVLRRRSRGHRLRR